jgi:hypothetical protein
VVRPRAFWRERPLVGNFCRRPGTAVSGRLRLLPRRDQTAAPATLLPLAARSSMAARGGEPQRSPTFHLQRLKSLPHCGRPAGSRQVTASGSPRSTGRGSMPRSSCSEHCRSLQSGCGRASRPGRTAGRGDLPGSQDRAAASRQRGTGEVRRRPRDAVPRWRVGARDRGQHRARGSLRVGRRLAGGDRYHAAGQ